MGIRVAQLPQPFIVQTTDAEITASTEDCIFPSLDCSDRPPLRSCGVERADATHRSTEEAVLHIMGALRAPTTGGLVRRVETALERGERCIVLNLASVSDLDAAGVGALVQARNLAEAAGGHLRVVDDGGWTRALLARTGLLGILKARHR
jgi:anti-anti-sigma factor